MPLLGEKYIYQRPKIWRYIYQGGVTPPNNPELNMGLIFINKGLISNWKYSCLKILSQMNHLAKLLHSKIFARPHPSNGTFMSRGQGWTLEGRRGRAPPPSFLHLTRKPPNHLASPHHQIGSCGGFALPQCPPQPEVLIILFRLEKLFSVGFHQNSLSNLLPPKG